MNGGAGGPEAYLPTSYDIFTLHSPSSKLALSLPNLNTHCSQTRLSLNHTGLHFDTLEKYISRFR